MARARSRIEEGRARSSASTRSSLLETAHYCGAGAGTGIPLHVVAARIGDDPKVLLATYAHLLPTSDAEAAERVAALIS
jgi:hypothetical protein